MARLVWNSVAPLESWEFDLAGLDPDHEGDESEVEDEQEPTAPGLEGERVETANFPWTLEASPDQWRSYLATHSGYAVMDPLERDRRLDAARDVVMAACEQLGRSTAPVHHQAVCFRWRPQTTLNEGGAGRVPITTVAFRSSAVATRGLSPLRAKVSTVCVA